MRYLEQCTELVEVRDPMNRALPWYARNFKLILGKLTVNFRGILTYSQQQKKFIHNHIPIHLAFNSIDASAQQSTENFKLI